VLDHTRRPALSATSVEAGRLHGLQAKLVRWAGKEQSDWSCNEQSEWSFY